MSKWKCQTINCYCSCEVNLDLCYLPAYCICFSDKNPKWEPVHNEPEQFKNSEQLPKLTVEVFDRPNCPEWARYAAVDKDGEGWYYEEKPIVGNSHSFVETIARARNFDGEFDATDWQNSLIERPQKVTLPDWCKVGEWVYFLDGEDWHVVYMKIDRINENGYLYGGENDIHYLCAKKARLRPYNSDEMRGMVGKVIEDNIGNRCMITVFTVADAKIVAFNSYCSAYKLLELGYTINGEPCGVFEHLDDNGEWVE